MRAAVGFVAAIAATSIAISCAAARPASYAAELEICLQSAQDCSAYVTCRKRVAASYGREFNAICKDQGDAGHD